ncbi:MAG: catalase [Clostridia bacterium]|nr:catalase [Clostridia bacterium]
MKIGNLFAHTSLVLRHKWGVLRNCAKCGLIWRGLVHDLSKFTPSEFFESVRYYQGNRSPIGACRRDRGYSLAWLHHKGRNKHHLEYWYDGECKEQPLMPYKYAVECVCDKLAATRTYAGKSYSSSLPLEHWRRYGCKVAANEKTLRFLDEIFIDVEAHGEDYVLCKKYMKAKYREICS